jgi:hypothetical protein
MLTQHDRDMDRIDDIGTIAVYGVIGVGFLILAILTLLLRQ